MQLKSKLRVGLIVGALIGGIAFAPPALAETPEAGDYVEVQMTGVPVTEANAIEYGFEVRTGADGVKYAVHPSTPAGDFSAAVPIVAEPAPGTVTPFTTAYGDCGSSWIYFTSKTTFRTGYQIYTTFGNTISYSWSAAFSSSIDLISRPFGGLATQRWEVKTPHGAQALAGTKMSATAGGSVLTTGGICFSLSPYDTVTW